MDRALEGIAIHLWALSVESYLRKGPGLVCCVGERKTYTESSPCKIGSRLSAVEDFGSSDTHPQVRTFYFYSAFFLICLKWERWLSGKESACQWMRSRFSPWVGKILWRRKWQPTPVFLPGKSPGQTNSVGYSPWGRTRLSD